MLEKLPNVTSPDGPVVAVIMDGIGWREDERGNAVASAHTPTLDLLASRYPHCVLRAHGTAVGMPGDSDMGNSEVGHNALGSGQVFSQGAALVNEAIASGKLFEGVVWQSVIEQATGDGATLHFLGLFSDGNVHSHIDHLRALAGRAAQSGVQRIRVHTLLDGRDVGETSALDYVLPFEEFLHSLNCDARIASGGGRQRITMDRYEADWAMVEAGWRTHVCGEGRQFASAEQAIRTLREESPGIIDQDLPAFVIAENETPVGRISDGDSVVLFNFRGDRAIEISRAFEEDEFVEFDRGARPNVIFAGMLQYDGDLQIPSRFLVAPPMIRHTMGENLAASGVRQLAIAETQKYGHVTYFWNGNRSGQFDAHLERYIEVPSDKVPFEQRPWMKSAEVTDALIAELRTRKYRTARVNYANGDMVGHTGNYQSARIAVECVDLALSRLLPVIDSLGGIALITADHGNAEEMFEIEVDTGKIRLRDDGTPKARTSHSLNPVPFYVYGAGAVRFRELPQAGLANVAATVVNLLGYREPKDWLPGLLEL